MTRSTRIILALTALAAALALTTTAANAATTDDLTALGYSVAFTNICSGFPCQATGCHDYAATGFGVSEDIGSDCDPEFQGRLDAFVARHPERKLAFQHPAAVAARDDLGTKGYTVATDYAAPAFHVTGGCNVDSTVDSAAIVTLDASLAAAAPCPPPPPVDPPVDPSTTTTTTTTPAAPASTTPTSTTPTTTDTPTSAPATPGTPTTTGAPAPAATPATTTATAPATVDPAVTDLQAQIDALKAQYDALNAKVDAIYQANIASWSAFAQASQDGASPADAALAARSAGENIVNGIA